MFVTFTLISAILAASAEPTPSRSDGAALYTRALAVIRADDALDDTFVYRFTSKHNNLSIGYRITKDSHDLVSVIAAFDGKTNTVVATVAYDPRSGSGRIAVPGMGDFVVTPYTVAPQLRGLSTAAAASTYCSSGDYIVTNAVCTMPPPDTFDPSKYAIADVGVEATGSDEGDHLVFTPRAPQPFAVSDAWVNAQSGRLLSLAIAGTGVFPSGTGSLRFDFASIGGHWLVNHVSILLVQSPSSSGSLDYTFDDFQFRDF